MDHGFFLEEAKSNSSIFLKYKEIKSDKNPLIFVENPIAGPIEIHKLN